MKQRILATLLSLCLLVGLLPSVALAEEERTAESTPQNLYVNNVALLDEGLLTEGHVDGTTYSQETNTLYLSNINITYGYIYQDSKTAGIYADGDLNIVLSGTNLIGESLDRAIYTTGELVVSGRGNLESRAAGIYAKALKMQTTGIINITASSECLHSSDGDIDIQSGTLNLTATSDSWAQVIYSAKGLNIRGGNIIVSAPSQDTATYTYGVYVNGGDIFIENACISSTAKQDSLYAKGNITINNGTIYALNGIRAQNSGSILIKDGNVEVGGKGLESVNDIYLLDGKIQITEGRLSAYNTIFIDKAQIQLSDNLTELKLYGTTYVLNKVEDFTYKLYSTDISSSLGYNSKSIAYVSNEENYEKVSYFQGTESNKNYAKGHFAYANGGIFNQDSNFDSESKSLAFPQKDGSIFGGWFENPEYSGQPATTYTGGKTYYAKWIGMDDIELQYGGEQQITVSGVTLSDYQSDNPSVATVDESGKVTATGVGTATISAAGTYNGQQTTFKATVTVTPRVLTYTLAGGDTGSGSISYNYSGGHHALSESMTFKWADEPGTEVILVEGTDINYTYTVNDPEAPDGGAELTYDYLPMPVGIYNHVQFNLLNENYTFAQSGGATTGNTLAITVNVVAEDFQRAYLASAWPKADQNFVYTGEGVLPVEGTLNAYSTNEVNEANKVDIDTFTINIEGLNGTSFHSEVSNIAAGTDLSSISGLTLPIEPGTYIITASAANDNYYLYKSLVFTIAKATVTIKANDQTIYVGDAMPEWTYTVSGLASGESLTTLPTFTCSTTNTNTAGTYTITPNGAAVPNTDRYNDAITYQAGTLTILNGSGGGSSSGGSSSSNVSGSGDDVSISASGGTVTDAQMESAVKKADKGSTITIKATSSTTVTLPVGGMADAADNDNDVLLDLRYGEVTLSARAIAGMTDGVSSNDKIKVSVANQTSSKDETISDLLNKGAAVFDVTVEVDGVEIHSFDGTLTITLTVSNLSKISDPHVLHILNNGTKEYYTPDRISGNTITVTGIRNLSTFAVIPGSEVPQTNPFTDVRTSDYYYDAVLWAADNGVTGGTSATTFSPNVTVTRAQMVTFLWRAHGSPKATGANPFTDVSTSDYYYDAVLWAVANGVTSGTSADTFGPDAAVTRAQAVTFQWRAAGSPVVSGSSFDDVAADAYYANAVAWAVANGITSGTGGSNFSPDVVVTRAQAVTFLWKELA